MDIKGLLVHQDKLASEGQWVQKVTEAARASKDHQGILVVMDMVGEMETQVSALKCLFEHIKRYQCFELISSFTHWLHLWHKLCTLGLCIVKMYWSRNCKGFLPPASVVWGKVIFILGNVCLFTLQGGYPISGSQIWWWGDTQSQVPGGHPISGSGLAGGVPSPRFGGYPISEGVPILGSPSDQV